MVVAFATGKRERILVVDDEPSVCELVHELLEEAGYEVVSARDGRDAVRSFFQWRPELVVLDISMPGMDGWNVLDRIREVSEAPVIIMSALDRENDAVRGLRNGADDYIVKPARTAELVARVDSLLRRARMGVETEGDAYTDGTLTLDQARHEVSVAGRSVDLTPQEFRLLGVLVRNAGLVMSADRLSELCWPGGGGGVENVRVYVGHLRRKLGDDPKSPRLIETVREFGYRYCPPAR